MGSSARAGTGLTNLRTRIDARRMRIDDRGEIKPVKGRLLGMCSGLQSGAGSFKQPDPKSIFDAKSIFYVTSIIFLNISMF
jgi:hypothetical protein